MQHRQLRLAFTFVSSLGLLANPVSAQGAPPAQPAPVAPAAPPPQAAESPPAPAPPAPPAPPTGETPPEAAPPNLLPTEAPPGPIEEAAPAPIEQVSLPVRARAGNEEEDESSMIVTGSRIRRSPELAKSAPVEVIDRKTLERTGATNAADLVMNLTAAQGSGFQGAGNVLNQAGGAAGTVSVNLRGLGAGATLILVNGRRLVPTGGAISETISDLGVIPLVAIERIEILKGGGSAIYGADAVGGVLNIITRSTFDGVRVELNGQGTTRADQGDVTVNGAFGAKSERSRVMIAMSYFRRSELTSDKRPFSRAANVDQNGNPATFIAPGFDPSNPMRLRFPDPACNNVPGSQTVPTLVNGMPSGDETCAFNYSRYYPLIGDLERANAFASGSFDLTSHTTLFGEFQASRMRSDGTATPSYSVPPPLLVIPADHVDNPFGRTVTMLGRPLGAAAGPKRTSASDDTFRVVAGLRGDLGGVSPDSIFDQWEWELSGSWGISRYMLLLPDALRDPLQNAINSCSDPSDLSRCFNPFYSAIDGTGTPNSQSVIDSFSGMQQSVADYSLQTYNAGMTGPIFPLPGGDVAVAFGGELRYEWRSTQLDHDSNEQRYVFFLGNTDARASRDVYSGYVELRWPFYRGIELQTAARIEHYTDIERTTPSPFAGLTLAPGVIFAGQNAAPIWRRLQLVGQVTSEFRAPTLFQSYPGFSVVPTLLNVPGSPVPVFTPVQNFGNQKLDPERALVISAGINWQPINELSLNFEFWHYGYKDRIALESATQALANDVALMAMGSSDPRVVRDPMSGAIQRVQVQQRNIAGTITTNGIDYTAMMALSGENFGSSRDAWGTISFGTQGTLTLNYFFPRELAAPRTIPAVSPAQSLPPLHCSGGSCQAVGSRNYNNFAPPLPRWRMNFPIHWNLKGHTASVIGHFLSGIENDNDVRANGSLGQLPAQFTLDLQYGYTIRDWFGKELGFRIGFYNVFDTLPPATRDTNGYETLLYDPRGRMVYAKLNSTF